MGSHPPPRQDAPREFLLAQPPAPCFIKRAMILKQTSAFARRGPDILTEELAAALREKESMDFKDLLPLVIERSRARGVGGAEDMLRLRIYEKLQALVKQGSVKKLSTGAEKRYGIVQGDL